MISLPSVPMKFSLWRLARFGVLTSFCVGFGAYLYQDYRSDQYLDLSRTITITDSNGLRTALRRGDINRNDFSPMLFVVIEGDFPRAVENLLGVGVDLNVRDTDGHTPLQVAERLDRKEIVQMLKQAGARQ